MKNLLPVAFVLLSFVSCQRSQTNSAPELFNKNGVSVTAPSGWSITDQEALEANGNYLSIEKDGFTSSGIVTIVGSTAMLNQKKPLNSNKLTCETTQFTSIRI